MDNGYTWRESRDARPLRLPGPDNMGWWVAVAFFVAVILHVAAFFALGHIKIGPGITSANQELSTERVVVRDVDISPPDTVMVEPDPVVKPPPDTATLLEEIDMLAKLPEDTEMDIKPDLADPEFAVRLENPAIKGEAEGIVVDPAAGFDLDTALPELGRSEDPLPIAADAQIIVDPGASIVADDTNLDRFAEDLLKKGAGGVSDVGTLDGMVTLDDMVGLSADVLVGKKTMLPSDLLFEYDSAVLRESAKVGMMKLALIIERNPKLYCWIEGYSDLFGADAYNQDLSRRRAASVREYLVNTLHLNGDRIVPRGHGKARPLVATGSVEEQALNRRVEIRMRRTTPPAEKPVVEKPQVAPQAPTPQPTPPKEAPAPAPPAPVVVKPMRALPVVEDAPRAKPISEQDSRPKPLEEQTPRARPIQETPPKAQPVQEEQEEAPRAQGVEEEADPEPVRAVPVE